jgi:hypothetical protein
MLIHAEIRCNALANPGTSASMVKYQDIIREYGQLSDLLGSAAPSIPTMASSSADGYLNWLAAMQINISVINDALETVYVEQALIIADRPISTKQDFQSVVSYNTPGSGQAASLNKKLKTRTSVIKSINTLIVDDFQRHIDIIHDKALHFIRVLLSNPVLPSDIKNVDCIPHSGAQDVSFMTLGAYNAGDPYATWFLNDPAPAGPLLAADAIIGDNKFVASGDGDATGVRIYVLEESPAYVIITAECANPEISFQLSPPSGTNKVIAITLDTAANGALRKTFKMPLPPVTGFYTISGWLATGSFRVTYELITQPYFTNRIDFCKPNDGTFVVMEAGRKFSDIMGSKPAGSLDNPMLYGSSFTRFMESIGGCHEAQLVLRAYVNSYVSNNRDWPNTVYADLESYPIPTEWDKLIRPQGPGVNPFVGVLDICLMAMGDIYCSKALSKCSEQYRSAFIATV